MNNKTNHTVKAWNRYSHTIPANCNLIIWCEYSAYDENHAMRQAIVDVRKWNSGEQNKEKRINALTCNGHYANV